MIKICFKEINDEFQLTEYYTLSTCSAYLFYSFILIRYYEMCRNCRLSCDMHKYKVKYFMSEGKIKLDKSTNRMI